MFGKRRKVQLVTERLLLRPLKHSDYGEWSALRRENEAFLKPWEPTWADDHLQRRSFTNRVYWANRSIANGQAVPLLIFHQSQKYMLGGVTLDNIKRGPAQFATIGYWMGQAHTRQGFMCEAIEAVVHYAFNELDLSRVQGACLPENVASRGVLEKSGFKYEGVAQSYLQINGRWRTHVLYANLRGDRRGKTDAG